MRAAVQVICHFLGSDQGSRSVAGLRVLELGAGVGLCGMAAAAAGAQSVVMTDGNLLALDLLKRNCEASTAAAEIRATQLHWGKGAALDQFVSEHKGFDLVLAADVVYDLSFAQSFFETAHTMLVSTDGQLLMSYVPRGSMEDVNVVVAAAESAGMALQGDAELELLIEKLGSRERFKYSDFPPVLQCFRCVYEEEL